MYEGLLDKYGIIFEGMPEPVFYKYFYSTGNDGAPEVAASSTTSTRRFWTTLFAI